MPGSERKEYGGQMCVSHTPTAICVCVCICPHHHGDKHTETDMAEQPSERAGRGEKRESELLARRIVAVTKHDRYL